MSKTNEWKHIGNFGVDAGLCWIGDPCYILHSKDLPESVGKNWSEFCDKLPESEYPTTKSFNYSSGHEGLGVVVSTGFGDGFYPVYARIVDAGDWGKRVAEIRIHFQVDNDELSPEHDSE